MIIKCSDCDGKGFLYPRVGTDVYITECKTCKGWGLSVETKVAIRKFHDKVQSVNLDELESE